MSNYDELLASARHQHELLRESEIVFTQSAKDYIPQMCKALEEENPNHTKEDIRERVKIDCFELWSRSVVYEALPDKYKDETKQHKKKIEVSGPNQTESLANNQIEVISYGVEDTKIIPDVDVEADGRKIIESLYHSEYGSSENKESDSIRKENEELKRTIKTLQAQQNNQNQPTPHKPLEYTSDDIEQWSHDQLIDEVVQLREALTKSANMFLPASELSTTAKVERNGNEITVPGKILAKFFAVLVNGEKQAVYLTIKDKEVVDLEGHNQRLRREGITAK